MDGTIDLQSSDSIVSQNNKLRTKIFLLRPMSIKSIWFTAVTVLRLVEVRFVKLVLELKCHPPAK